MVTYLVKWFCGLIKKQAASHVHPEDEHAERSISDLTTPELLRKK